MAVVGVALRQNPVSVDAGAEVNCPLTVRNLSSVVQRLDIVIGGDVAEWIVAEPAAFSLLAGQDREVVVRIRPPRGPIPHAGAVPVKVMVVPRDTPTDRALAELDLTVNPFVSTTGTIDPPVSRGFRRARHVLRVTNDGNVPAVVEVAAEDPDRLLEVEVRPEVLELEPGSSGKARIGVRVIPGWPVGDDRSRPFRATVRTAGHPPLTLGAAMRLRTVDVRALLPVAAVAAALAVAGLLVFGGNGTRPQSSVVADGTLGTTAAPGTTAPAGATTSPIPATTVAPTPTSSAGSVPAAGPGAAIALGARCRPTTDVVVKGRELSSADGSFFRRFGDESTAIAARDFLVRKPTFCTIAKASRDEAELTFYPPPVEPTPAVPGSKCTARYLPERLTKSKGPDGTFVVEMGPRLNLYFSTEADRDRAFALLQGYSQICWLGGGSEDIFSNFFDWQSALTYF